MLVPPAVLAAPPPREDDAGKVQRLYGEVIDPDGNCKVRLSGSKISIAIPGSDHSLAIERGQSNAPRVLKEWEGDFQVSVTVDAPFPKAAKSTVTGRNPFHGAGLLVFADAKNTVQFLAARRFV